MELLKTMVCRVCGERKELKHFRSLKAMVGKAEKKCLCKPCQRNYIKKLKEPPPVQFVVEFQ